MQNPGIRMMFYKKSFYTKILVTDGLEPKTDATAKKSNACEDVPAMLAGM
jgi:hypothetical protein